jgi:hypothetical protein
MGQNVHKMLMRRAILKFEMGSFGNFSFSVGVFLVQAAATIYPPE